MKTIRRLFELWALYGRNDALHVTRNSKEFVSWFISDLVSTSAAVLGMLLLAERFSGIGAWSKSQIVFMLGYATMTTGVVAFFFGYNVSHISRRLGRGQFDHTLVQPQPLWMSLVTEGFSPAYGFATLLPGIALLSWAMSKLQIEISIGWLALFGISLLSSTAIVMAYQYLWGALAFWAPKGAEEISSDTMRMIEQLKSFPLDRLGPALTMGLLTAIPSGFVAWYPARHLLGIGSSPEGAWVTPIAAVVFCTFAWIVFGIGLRYYGQTGSQRYTDFGHRR